MFVRDKMAHLVSRFLYFYVKLMAKLITEKARVNERAFVKYFRPKIISQISTKLKDTIIWIEAFA